MPGARLLDADLRGANWEEPTWQAATSHADLQLANLWKAHLQGTGPPGVIWVAKPLPQRTSNSSAALLRCL
jgi:uncharacterized protein YjbI with pentapeptide repeats